MSPRIAGGIGLGWAALALALHVIGGREHVEVLAGASGTTWQLALGSAIVVAHLLGVFVVGPCVIAGALAAITDRVSRR